MAGRPKELPTLPLFPLPNVVHFPDTDLELHVFEPRYRTLVRDLEALEAAGEPPLVGMVVLRPGERDAQGRPAIYPAGTAGRLMAIEALPDGRSNITLRGQFRFTIEAEYAPQPYRTASVRPLPEPRIAEGEPGVLLLRRELVELSEGLAREMGDRFPLSLGRLAALGDGGGFAEIVNNLAADLDLPVRRKLLLLDQSLPERALEVLSVLRSRRKVMDLLRPFRGVAGSPEHN